MTQLYTVINTYKWTVFTCSRACCFEFNLGYFYGIVCCFTHEFSYLGPVCFFYGFCVFLVHFFVACLEFSCQYQCKQFAWCVCVCLQGICIYSAELRQTSSWDASTAEGSTVHFDWQSHYCDNQWTDSVHSWRQPIRCEPTDEPISWSRIAGLFGV